MISIPDDAGPSLAGPSGALILPDAESWRDLGTYLGRARRLDPDGAVRLVVDAGVLAAYVSPLHPAGLGDPLPTVLGLRTARALAPEALDIVVPLSAMADRFARGGAAAVAGLGSGELAELPLPPGRVGAAWSGISPPRRGWGLAGMAEVAVLRDHAEHGIREIAEALPQAAGAHIVETVRRQIWGSRIPGYSGLPRGAAFAAEGLGFLDSAEPIALYLCGPWLRLSSPGGHVIARASTALA